MLAVLCTSSVSIDKSAYLGLSVLICKIMMVISSSWGCHIGRMQSCMPRTRRRIGVEYVSFLLVLVETKAFIHAGGG